MNIDIAIPDNIPESERNELRSFASRISNCLKDGRASAIELIKKLEEIVDLAETISAETGEPLYVSAPSEAPEKFKPRTSIKADDFLMSTYRPWLDAGVLFRQDVKRLDLTLLNALDFQYKGRKEELRRILPTKSDAVNRQLETIVGRSVEPNERDVLVKRGNGFRKTQLRASRLRAS